MSKIKTKTMVAEVVLKRSKGSKTPLPDFGLGKGVLSSAEVKWLDTAERGFGSLQFAVRKRDFENDAMREVVEVRWREVE